MRILFNDLIQKITVSNGAIRTPSLADVAYTTGGGYIAGFNFDQWSPVRINAIGIGNTDGTWFEFRDISHNRPTVTINFSGNGLYPIPEMPNDLENIDVYSDATYVGRIAMGLAMQIGTSVRKEPSFNSTAEPRTTLSGQVIPGRGGHIFRAVSLDSRYKIDEAMMNEIKEGYKYIGMGYPFFINLEDEAYKLPFDRLYAIDRNQMAMGFESGVKRFLYSRRWDFEERF